MGILQIWSWPWLQVLQPWMTGAVDEGHTTDLFHAFPGHQFVQIAESISFGIRFIPQKLPTSCWAMRSCREELMPLSQSTSNSLLQCNTYHADMIWSTAKLQHNCCYWLLDDSSKQLQQLTGGASRQSASCCNSSTICDWFEWCANKHKFQMGFVLQIEISRSASLITFFLMCFIHSSGLFSPWRPVLFYCTFFFFNNHELYFSTFWWVQLL